MGLSIHYSGTIKDAEQIPQLVEEVQDVCTAFNWHYHFDVYLGSSQMAL